MKLNGALKPRQGASSQGSSPGVVLQLRKYRDKRYNKQNENVVNGLPLNDCGLNNKNNNNSSSKNNNSNNQQHQQQMKCGENPTSSLCSSFFTCNSNSNNNSNNKQHRITTTAAAAANIDYNSHGSRKSTTINQNKQERKNHNDDGEEEEKEEDVVKLKQKPVKNITTRQVNKEKINNKDNNNNNKEKLTEKVVGDEVEGVKVQFLTTTLTATSDTSKYHVTPNKNSSSSSSNSNNNLFCKEVNKFLLISNIYENVVISHALTFLTVIISWLFIHFKLLLFLMFSHTERTHLTGNLVGSGRSGGGGVGGGSSRVGTGAGASSFDSVVAHNSANIMRASQSFKESFERICLKNVFKSRLHPKSIALCLTVYVAAAILLPQPVLADDGDNFYPINGLETTTPEFDYASRGQKKFGDKCENTLECGFPGSICDPKKKSCQCTEDLPVTNHIDKCGKEAAVNESCFFNEQCEVKYFQTECRDQRCVCRFDMSPIWLKDGTVECKGRGEKKPERYIDPAMIGVLIGMALMFIIICVVLRLFSQARWRENRTIFNTPNPRLMNVSLLRESKLLHGQERRGSRMSVRAPSRQPSMASLRPHSPNPSLGSRSNSHGSNASATSLRSTRSNSVSPAGIVVNNSHHERKGSTYQPHHHHQHHPPQHPQHHLQQQPQQHHHHHHQQQAEEEHEQQQPLTQTNIISNPVAENVTVEIIEPEK